MKNSFFLLFMEEEKRRRDEEHVRCDSTCRHEKWLFQLEKSYVLLLSCSSLCAWLSYLTSKYYISSGCQDDTSERNPYHPSSVWCHAGPLGERLCRFHNICYDPYFKEFQFYMSNESVISGVQSPELWKNIDMSTVLGHNAFKMKISILSLSNIDPVKTARFIKERTFIISRFKSDNIMHVIHDDLIPLHFTIQSIFDKTAIFERKVSLAFSDDTMKSTLDKWYRLYSGTNITSLTFSSENICFQDAYVGLLRSTLWFNYGFKQQQGAFTNENFSLKGLTNFVSFHLNAWGTKSEPVTFQSLKAVVVVRSQTRKILNREVLVRAIEKACAEMYPSYKLDILEVDFAQNDTSSILSHIKQAKLLVGMHGAGLILSLFLPPSSAVVELFPFGINPDNVSFLKALLKQHDLYHFHYEYWQNNNRNNSVPGPQTDPLLGKITHLPQSMQSNIKSLSEVPPVHCCHDPAYLYYINHDTYIDAEVYIPILKALKRTKKNEYTKSSVFLKNVFPSLPEFVTCEVSNNVVFIKWGAMSNSEYNEGLWFQITVQSGHEVTVQNVTDGFAKTFNTTVKNSSNATQVWFQALNNKNVGSHVMYTICVNS